MGQEGPTAAVLTVSDRGHRGEAQDTSGPALESLLKTSLPTLQTVHRLCVPDEAEAIKTAIIQWADRDKIDLIVTTGGTGFSPRDITPEVVRELIDREAPGMATCMTVRSLEVTPLAMLSRPVCGIRQTTLIATLPGSKKGATECLSFLLPALPHAIDSLRAHQERITATHTSLQQSQPSSAPTPSHPPHHHVCPHATGSKPAGLYPVAHRPRQSPFPMLPMNEAVPLVIGIARVLEPITLKLTDPKLVGSVLATPVVAKEPFPPFPASIKDGYAVVASDGPGEYVVLGPVEAGSPSDMQVKPGTVARITTGAPVPSGADAVIQVEDTELVESSPDGTRELRIKIHSRATVGQDIRPIGYDISTGEVVLEEGAVLGASEVGLLATVGVLQVSVRRRPVVAILSTGNELQQPGDKPQAGKIYDSNKIMLMEAVRGAGGDPIDMGIATDTSESTEERISECVKVADIVVTTGGVSMGEKDLLKPVLIERLGATVHFGRVFMKPGKPTTFATIPRPQSSPPTLMFGLPGNPVSAAVTFHLFVHPVIRKMLGYENPSLPRVDCLLDFDASLDPRPEYQRAVLRWDQTKGCFIATTTGGQCSSRLLSMRSANALLELPPSTQEQTKLGRGTKVAAIMIGGL
eukprot:comp20315_c0_seq1/m.25545 comp20315_c0_seq1/g.25545  ORF comp20315_c0_seq1/g.25545 comp20315_c0_seq1/m.25545 type:complete len:636 (-) comp20315_c0_seq1:337-2244(-)